MFIQYHSLYCRTLWSLFLHIPSQYQAHRKSWNAPPSSASLVMFNPRIAPMGPMTSCLSWCSSARVGPCGPLDLFKDSLMKKAGVQKVYEPFSTPILLWLPASTCLVPLFPLVQEGNFVMRHLLSPTSTVSTSLAALLIPTLQHRFVRRRRQEKEAICMR